MDISEKKANGAFVILEDGEGNILFPINRRSPVQYEFPGGGQEPQETLEETVKREAFEEVGISISPTLIANLKTRLQNGSDVYLFYHKCERTKEEFNLCNKEVSGAKWMSRKEVTTFVKTEICLRKLGKPYQMLRAHFAMLIIFLHWENRRQLVNGYLSVREGEDLRVENYLKP